MSERLLTLYERSPSRRYQQLMAAVWPHANLIKACQRRSNELWCQQWIMESASSSASGSRALEALNFNVRYRGMDLAAHSAISSAHILKDQQTITRDWQMLYSSSYRLFALVIDGFLDLDLGLDTRCPDVLHLNRKRSTLLRPYQGAGWTVSAECPVSKCVLVAPAFAN